MKRNTISRWIWIGSLLVTSLAVALVTISYNLLATEAGSQWIIQKTLLQKDNNLSWRSMEGTLMKGFLLSGLKFNQDNIRIEANHASSQWSIFSLLSGRIIIKKLDIKDVTITLKPQSNTSTNRSWPAIRSFFPIKFSDINVANITINKNHSTSHIEEINISGTIGILSNRLKKFSLKQTNRQLTMSGKIGSTAPYSIKLNVDWHALSEDKKEFSGSANINGNLSKLELSHQLKTPFQINTSGSITTDFEKNRMAMDMNKFDMNLTNQWPLIKHTFLDIDKTVQSSGQLKLMGSINNYIIDSHFDLSSTQQDIFPKQSITISAKGDQTKADIDSLTAISDAAHIKGTGKISWQNNLNWNANLTGTQINPGIVLKDWPGQIQSNVVTQGSLTSKGISSNVTINNLTGTLRGYPLSAVGHLSYNNNTFFAKELILAIDNNQLILDASFNHQLDAQWQLNAQDLSAIHPQASGVMHSQGSMSGTVSKPRINATINANTVSFANLSATSIKTRITAQNDEEHQIKTGIIDASVDSQTPIALTLLADGKLSKHSYIVTASNKDTSLKFKGLGNWNQNKWHSNLSIANVSSTQFGNWKLLNPIDVDLLYNQSNKYTKSKATPACWVSGDSKLCAKIKYETATGVDLVGKLQHLALSRTNLWLPPNSQINGQLNGDIALSGKPNNIDGKLNFTVDTGHVQLNDSEKILQEIPFHNAIINGTINNNTLHLNTKAEFLKTGFAESHIITPLRKKNAPIDAGLVLKFDELNWLAPFFPQFRNMKGRTDLNLKLTGTRNTPQLSGSVIVNNISVDVPELGTQLKNGSLRITHKSKNDWHMNGTLDSGEGTLQLNGSATINNFDNWHSQFKISGEQWQAVDLESVNAQVNPQLLLQASPNKISIQGDIDITQAQIKVKELPPNTIAVSKDEIIINSGHLPKRSLQTTLMASDINLNLGKNTTFNGFGIKGDLEGSLRVQEQSEQPLRIAGTVKIVNGTYKAYGQELSINPGRLIFQGNPDNPTIDVRASRTVEETLVGIQIGGTANSLTSELYSVPVLPPTETMALLITGKSLSSATEEDANVLMSAVTSLGITQSAILTRYLQRTFGLDVLTLSSGATIEESIVTIGKYLTPNLFVSYVQEILTPNSSFNFEYSLSDKLKIKAKSGIDQSMDILYRIDH